VYAKKGKVIFVYTNAVAQRTSKTKKISQKDRGQNDWHPCFYTVQYLARIMALSLFLTVLRGEHIGRDVGPFLHRESFQILDILRLHLRTPLFN
jgi:hypothetical protein